ncbi:hypothetical protein C4J81_05495 [Deltaproteobacteria bacterium Smac51]|nr:hypothetical protein C4J81_05495 [Deltaproteobacteria bacterium Smac51]
MSSWNIKARLREITAAEKGLAPKDPGGRISVALIWPGDYRTGMSALGYLSIYGFLNGRSDVLAERFFLPDGQLAREYERTGTRLLSLESGRTLSEFDLVAASLSLENDYWLLPRILTLGGLAPHRDERGEESPIVIAGGVAVWANPWPIVPFADMVLTGEAEAQWPQLISAWDEVRLSSLPKPGRVRHLSRKTPGAFDPGAVTELLSTPPGEEFRDLNPIRPASLAWPPPEDLSPPVSPIISPGAEFSNTKLVEISRGCPYGCRFCLAGFIFRPHRPWPLAKILDVLGEPEGEGEKVGLVSPAAADYPWLDELLSVLFEQNRSVTLSSLRLTALTPELADRFAKGRLHGVAVAPEGGSQRLRDIINKELTEAQILEGARLLAEAGLRKIKLYFMVGLPFEMDEDLYALADLCRKIREAARTATSRPELQVSLANFTPKAHTPFEDAPMATEAELRRKGKLISAALKGIPRLSVNLDPPLWSIVQAILARGGPESGRLVEAMLDNQGRMKPSLSAIGYSPGHPIHHQWPEDRPKPWRIVEPAAGFDCLAVERERSERGLVTKPCPLENGCGRCGACTNL